jgi:hypothetical protein
MKDNNDILHGGKLKPDFIKAGLIIMQNLLRLMRKKVFPYGA